jgi:hypothetical protein
MATKKWCGVLIVVSPEKPRPFKLRFTSKALLYLTLTIMAAFLAVVTIGYIPSLMIDRARVRLGSENQQLKIKNMNDEMIGLKLQDRVSRIEEQAQHIQELFDTQ